MKFKKKEKTSGIDATHSSDDKYEKDDLKSQESESSMVGSYGISEESESNGYVSAN